MRVADDWDDLVDGTLQNPIDRTEAGVVVVPDGVEAFAWTGT